uniref:Uncharacterized protein n=1 Tax=Amphilophus citrinellus TaxID=61819 RepID=A0A3Q0T1Z5_AMPCI
MGTVLSLSPGSRKAARGPEELAVKKPLESGEKEDEKDGRRKKKGHPVLLHALSWKKRLVAARAKRKGGTKVKPAVSEPGHVQREHRELRAPKSGHKHRPIPVPVPTVPDQNQRQEGVSEGNTTQKHPSTGSPPLKLPPTSPLLVSLCPLQASTGELLRCLSDFMCRRCVKLKELSSNQIVLWFRNVDRALLVQGWQVSARVCVPSPLTGFNLQVHMKGWGFLTSDQSHRLLNRQLSLKNRLQQEELCMNTLFTVSFTVVSKELPLFGWLLLPLQTPGGDRTKGDGWIIT